MCSLFRPIAVMTPDTASLLDIFIRLLKGLAAAWPQDRTSARAVRLALGHVLCLGAHNIARVIATCGRDQLDWSSEYRLFSRCKVATGQMFRPVLAEAVALALPPGTEAAEPLWIAGDHTHLIKSGKHIPGVQTIRDPMSPAYHVNLCQGMRFFHLAVLAAPWRKTGDADVPARSLSVLFEPSPTIRRPGKRATADEHIQYKKQLRERHSAQAARNQIQQLRVDADACGAAAHTMIVALDGAFSNKVFFKTPMERVELIARLRKDASLCFQAPPPVKGKPRSFYAKEKFTPDQVRCDDETYPWSKVPVRTGGIMHEIRYKEITDVLWQRGAGRRKVRLIVIAPTGYRLTKKSKLLYRAPAYLITTDLTTPAVILIQGYIDRWQIEVTHREIKDTFGVEDSQVRNAESVPRHPAFGVAICSLLHIAAIKAFGPRRTSDYLPRPKWGRHSVRPSLLDIIQLVRDQTAQRVEQGTGEAANHTASLPGGLLLDLRRWVTKAAA